MSATDTNHTATYTAARKLMTASLANVTITSKGEGDGAYDKADIPRDLVMKNLEVFAGDNAAFPDEFRAAVELVDTFRTAAHAGMQVAVAEKLIERFIAGTSAADTLETGKVSMGGDTTVTCHAGVNQFRRTPGKPEPIDAPVVLGGLMRTTAVKGISATVSTDVAPLAAAIVKHRSRKIG